MTFVIVIITLCHSIPSGFHSITSDSQIMCVFCVDPLPSPNMNKPHLQSVYAPCPV